MKHFMKIHWIRNTLLIFCCCAVIGLIFSLVIFRRDNARTYAYSNISFTFDGAQNGLAPNGYAFDVNAIASEEVLTSAIKAAGMDERYSSDQIVSCIEIQGVFPEDLVEEMTRYNSVINADSSQSVVLTEYHPTVFRVCLYSDFDRSISETDLTKLLNEILTSYRSWFLETYATGTIDGLEFSDLDDYDYFQQLEILRVGLQQASDYAAQMAVSNPGFLFEGKGFHDLSLQFESMISSDLARLNATMTMNSLSKDLNRLKERYLFEIRELQNRVDIQTDLSKSLDNLLAEYAKSGIIYLSTSEQLSRVDKQSSEVYDRLADTRGEVTDKISGLNKDIAGYRNQLAEMGVNADGTKTDSQKTSLSKTELAQKEAALQSGLNRLLAKHNTAIDTLKEMIDTLNSEEINELTLSSSSARAYSPSIISGKFIKTAIKTCGPFCALGLIAAVILIIISRIATEKNH